MKTIMQSIQSKMLFCAVVVLGFAFIGESSAQRKSSGSSFGGSRGGSSSRSSFAQPKSAPPSGGSSFGGARSAPSMSPNRGSAPSSASPGMSGGIRQPASAPSATGSIGATAPRSSFGGSRLGSGNDYRKSYGIPRQTSPQTLPGYSSPVMMHRYGGFSDGLMMGYMMGHSSWMWSMPFHPAFYYSRPHVVYATDGTTVQEVYPPTFSFFRMILTIGIVLLLVYIVVRIVRARRGASYSGSSFG
jgi:hypothetical protein